MESGSLVILSESLVILSAAKDLALGSQMLHYAQHDTTGFGRYSSLSVATSDNQGNPIALPEL